MACVGLFLFITADFLFSAKLVAQARRGGETGRSLTYEFTMFTVRNN